MPNDDGNPIGSRPKAAHDDTDFNVAEARALARRLNDALDVLKTAGVHCISVVGPPASWFMGSTIEQRDLTRVSLVLDFKPERKPDPATQLREM